MLHRLAVAVAAVTMCSVAATAHPPRGIVVDGRGNVYFSDLLRIWKIDPRGRLTLARAVPGRHVHELAIDRAGAVHGEESSYDAATERFPTAIWKMTPDGRVSYSIPTTTSPPLGAGLWRDGRGCTYTSQQDRGRGPLLFRRCPARQAELLYGSPADARGFRQVLLSDIGGTAFGPGGAFYFRHGATVRKRSPSGIVATVATGLPAENFGIAVGSDGALYVAEHGARRVSRTAPGGGRVAVMTSAPPWSPTGVAWRGGILYVLEVGQRDPRKDPAYRVRTLSNGRVATLATLAAGR